MSLLRIIKYGHPTLRLKAETGTAKDATPEFIADLIQTMFAEDGVGLAATQVNVAKRIIVARNIEKNSIHVLINPVIMAVSEKKIVDTEGCLSLPHLQAQVERHFKIEVKAQDPDGQIVHLKAKDYFARVLQHEIDHLNGILYIDRAIPSSLVWLTRKEGAMDKDELEKIPITLREVQERYTALYHKDRKKIIFQPELNTGGTGAQRA